MFEIFVTNIYRKKHLRQVYFIKEERTQLCVLYVQMEWIV